MRNCGIVYVEDGELSKEELIKEFSEIYKTNWPWQVRALGRWSYVVKFPPHISVEQVAGYPCFGLTNPDITVNVEVWKEELKGMEDLKEVWVQVRGLLPRWCEWSVLDQCTSAFGLLIDLDWQGMFQSLFECVRVKVQCRDPTKIPTERVFCIGGKTFKVRMTVEVPIVDLVSKDAEVNGGGDDNREDPRNQKDMDTDGLANQNNTANDSASGSNGGSLSGRGNGSGADFQKRSIDGNASSEFNICFGEVQAQVCDVGLDISFVMPMENPEMEATTFIFSEMQQLNEMAGELEDLEIATQEVGVMTQADSLPEDIMPTFHSLGDNEVLQEKKVPEEQGVQKRTKQKNWGPVQAARKSTRVLGSQNTIEKAQLLKMKQNLEIPTMRGVGAGVPLSQGLDQAVSRSPGGKCKSFKP
ncbi:uncharacterized protein [Triticum aestivum]|uniref:uncharacterized protein n=1 Tax=Triticum aestivum TaxID=4565 RepID=UPI001D019C5A|nr:uncharacterized protein LOC123088631 [Triticum aestivum]